MDIYSGSNVDIVHDFNVFSYSFADNTFDEIICKSSLEHVDNFIKTVIELHCVSKPNALIKVYCPHYSGPDAYRDPTHKTFFSFATFDIFSDGGSYISPYNGLLQVEKRMFGIPEKTRLLKSIFKRFLNYFPDFYETHLCWIFPAKTIYYELRVLKAQ